MDTQVRKPFIWHFLDIETLDTDILAVILSIGITSIDLFSGRVLGELYFELNSNMQLTRSRSRGTVKWWDDRRDTDPDAYYAAFSGRGLLPEALEAITQYFNAFNTHYGDSRPRLVGCGPDFDNTIVGTAYKQFNMRTPWAFSGNRDFRTATELLMLLADVDPQPGVTGEGTFTPIAADQVIRKNGYLSFNPEVIKEFDDVNGRYSKLSLPGEFVHHALHDARAEGRTIQTRLHRLHPDRFGPWHCKEWGVVRNSFRMEIGGDLVEAAEIQRISENAIPLTIPPVRLL